jgi:ubiquinone/menaquinone biosynthesis C-methylase UbiE
MINNPEREVYEAIYSDNYYFHYGRTTHGKDVFKYILTLKPESIVDIGCGHNYFIKVLSKVGIKKVIGVDFACPSADIIADVLYLPFEDKEFDLLTSWDVLEHLLPEQVDQAISEMSRVSNRFAFTITYNPAGTIPPGKFKNHNLHQCCRQPSWWKEQIEKQATSCHNYFAYWVGKWK